MTKLEETIHKIKKYLSNPTYRQYFEKSEEQVKMQIINPILKSLGWDVENPLEVRFEGAIEVLKGRADYALVFNKKTVLIIEAKKAQKANQEDINQLATYAAPKGVKYGVYSTGVEWILVRSSTNNESNRKIWELNLKEDGVASIALKLNALSKVKGDFIEGIESKLQNITEMEEKILNAWKNIIGDKERFREAIFQELKKEVNINNDELLKEFLDKKITTFFSKISYNEKAADLGVKEFILDGQKHSFDRVANIFEIVVKWLIDKGDLKKEKCPIVRENSGLHLIANEKGDLIKDEKDEKGYYKNWGKSSELIRIDEFFCLKPVSKKEAAKYSKYLIDKFSYKKNTFIIQE